MKTLGFFGLVTIVDRAPERIQSNCVMAKAKGKKKKNDADHKARIQEKVFSRPMTTCISELSIANKSNLGTAKDEQKSEKVQREGRRA